MSMPGSLDIVDDGPYTECAECGITILDYCRNHDADPLCDECAAEIEADGEDEE